VLTIPAPSPVVCLLLPLAPSPACRYKSKKRAFTNYAKKYAEGGKAIDAELASLKKHCSVIRVLAHTQVRLLPIGQKKGHLMEIQVNGGTVEQKVDFAKSLFEKAVTVDSVFQPNEMIDTIAITKVGGGLRVALGVEWVRCGWRARQASSAAAWAASSLAGTLSHHPRGNLFLFCLAWSSGALRHTS
jgi:hypothetical protein